MALLGQIQEYDCLGLGAKGGVRQRGKGCEEHRDTNHDARQDLGELFWLLHGLGDGNDQSDTFKRKHFVVKNERKCCVSPMTTNDMSAVAYTRYPPAVPINNAKSLGLNMTTSLSPLVARVEI